MVPSTASQVGLPCAPRSVTPGRITPAGVILAIDYGRRRMGLAVSDALGMTARPLATWTRTNRRRDLSRLRELCREYSIARIVIGCPLHLDGATSEMAEEAGRFAERVRKHLGLPVELVDERLSSWEARRSLHETGPGDRASRRGKNSLDEVAAAVILRDYLARAPGATQG